MNAPILVTGGTGTIGSRVVPLLAGEGRRIRVLSRHPERGDQPDAGNAGDAGVGDLVQHVGGDTVRDQGLAEAMAGVDVVLHLAGGAKGDDVAARNVVAAARRAGVDRLVLISVIGADRMPIGYFRTKAAAERTLERSGLPFTVLRVAQLHDFVRPVVRAMARLPLLPAPGGLRFEPVDRDEVAARLAALTLGAAASRVPDLAGPEVLDLPRLAALYAEASGRRRHALLPVRLPGAVGRAYRAGDNLADESADRGRRTWAQSLSFWHGRGAGAAVTG
ncbi:SDR family oxidoreductase [Herbiconiux daphne]|uniref:NAD(P)H-binding protein n=1 Tax=Herbiconiux daphne TaxID=2970914 RepID=A0ABT2H852_9MICO|nr:NAD(P)H-binding protein [Herbiconiux daphne]MCS5736099.1 NAD(P)H-binding protein [Herbiconiux daphne]